MEFTKERLQIWQTIRHKSFTKDVLQNRIHLCLDEIERLQAENTELRSLLLWASDNINIPFYLFGAEDQRNVWKNRVMDILKRVNDE